LGRAFQAVGVINLIALVTAPSAFLLQMCVMVHLSFVIRCSILTVQMEQTRDLTFVLMSMRTTAVTGVGAFHRKTFVDLMKYAWRSIQLPIAQAIVKPSMALVFATMTSFLMGIPRSIIILVATRFTMAYLNAGLCVISIQPVSFMSFPQVVIAV
jgi:hypothetical protein